MRLILGRAYGESAPVRLFSDMFYGDVVMAAGAVLPLPDDHEDRGVYVVEGQHRAPMSFFMRNPKAGGCSVATPPDNLGFRLVREPGWRDRLPSTLRRLLAA